MPAFRKSRRRSVSRRRSYRRSRRSYGRRRRSTPSVFRSRGRMRRNNTGKFNVNRIMRTGHSLPQTAFGTCKIVVANQQHFLSGEVNTNTNTAAGLHVNDGRRTLVLTNLQSPYSWWQDQSLLQHIRAYGLFRLLYKQYLVLGAKVKIRLTPGILPLRYSSGGLFADYHIATNPPLGMPNMAAISAPENSGCYWEQKLNNNPYSFPAGLETQAFFNTNPNIYWYVRVRVESFGDDGTVQTTSSEVEIGHRMLANVTVDGNHRIFTEGDRNTCPWASLPDFLGDRTVSYSRDRKRWTTSSGVTAQGFNKDLVGLQGGLFSGTQSGRSPATIIRYNMSLRKLTKDKNVMRVDSPFWRNLTDSKLSALPFQVGNMPRQEVVIRYGCIWFDPHTGLPQYHYPYPVGFNAQTEIDYYCAWRKPTNIDVLNDPNLEGAFTGMGESEMELSRNLAKRKEVMEKLTVPLMSFDEVETNLQALESSEAVPDIEGASVWGASTEADEQSESELLEELQEPPRKIRRVQFAAVSRQAE